MKDVQPADVIELAKKLVPIKVPPRAELNVNENREQNRCQPIEEDLFFVHLQR